MTSVYCRCSALERIFFSFGSDTGSGYFAIVANHWGRPANNSRVQVQRFLVIKITNSLQLICGHHQDKQSSSCSFNIVVALGNHCPLAHPLYL